MEQRVLAGMGRRVAVGVAVLALVGGCGLFSKEEEPKEAQAEEAKGEAKKGEAKKGDEKGDPKKGEAKKGDEGDGKKVDPGKAARDRAEKLKAERLAKLEKEKQGGGKDAAPKEGSDATPKEGSDATPKEGSDATPKEEGLAQGGAEKGAPTKGAEEPGAAPVDLKAPALPGLGGKGGDGAAPSKPEGGEGVDMDFVGDAPSEAPKGEGAQVAQGGLLDLRGALTRNLVLQATGFKGALRPGELPGVDPSSVYNVARLQPGGQSQFGVAIQVWKEPSPAVQSRRFQELMRQYDGAKRVSGIGDSAFKASWGDLRYMVWVDRSNHYLATLICEQAICGDDDKLAELARKLRERLPSY